VDIERDDLTLFNVVACRPPDNKLVSMPYCQQAIDHCRPNLIAAIEGAKKIATENGKTFVIVTLGVTPFKAILGLDSKKDNQLLKKDYYAYPFWSDTYGAWVLACPHPAFLLRGNTHLWPIVQFVFKRALEIAEHGIRLDEPEYLLDPSTVGFDAWIAGYAQSLLVDPDNPLSYDIETPYKKKTDAEDELGKEEDADHTILRIAFSYWDAVSNSTCTVSVKWSAEFLAGIERLFALANYVLGWNSDKYDYPRVRRYVDVKGIGLDGMVAWHILNSSLPKALGFVTPFYWQNTTAWKYLADAQPAFYNAKDADAALRNWIGIKKDLETHRLWHVYERHWIQLHKALKFMSESGVLRDGEMRAVAEKQLSETLDSIEVSMDAAVPKEARDVKIYKKKPADLTGIFETTQEIPAKFCGSCGLENPTRWKKHSTLCGGEVTLVSIPQTIWGKYLDFKISKKRMQSYQQVAKHQAIIDRKEGKVTFDADAIVKLCKQYPKDPLYPLILEHRKSQKLLSTYIGVTDEHGIIRGGMPVGKDGKIHTQYGRDASTLRFTSEDPNLQNLTRPNPGDPSDPANFVRNLVVAGSGSVLYARDYSGIEAVLTGYFALDPRYIRLAKRDVHTYYTVHALYELEGGARIQAADLPNLDWPDDRLFPYLEELKSRFKKERNSLYKHLVHAANFMQGAMGARDKIFSETGIEYPVKTVQKVMDVYYALFPKIKQWHKNVLDEAEKDGYLRNPYDYVHRFSRVYEYTKERGEWNKRPGTDANRVISFKPQSTAVAIITEALLRLYHERFEDAGQYLRLQVHDELMFEIPRAEWERVNLIVKDEMERPSPNLRMPLSWGMGSELAILTEAKIDLNSPSRWGSMRGIKDE
jgi:DNA polymerase I-like protein with 3'-5' exonuclease and polymerase domains